MVFSLVEGMIFRGDPIGAATQNAVSPNFSDGRAVSLSRTLSLTNTLMRPSLTGATT